ncbi:hypothetical protein Aduo_003705 [Ancylostoma duodenale]
MRQKEGDRHLLKSFTIHYCYFYLCAFILQDRQDNNRQSKEVLRGSKEVIKESKESRESKEIGSQEKGASTAKPVKPITSESRELKAEQPTQEEASAKAKPSIKAPPAAAPPAPPIELQKQNLKDLQATQRYDVMGNENVGGYLSAGPDERAFTILMPVVQVEDDGDPKSYFNVLDPLKDLKEKENQTAMVEPGGMDAQQGKERDGSKEIKAAMKA